FITSSPAQSCTLFPSTTLFRSLRHAHRRDADMALHRDAGLDDRLDILGVVPVALAFHHLRAALRDVLGGVEVLKCEGNRHHPKKDRKSTRLNSSHVATSYAVFC